MTKKQAEESKKQVAILRNKPLIIGGTIFVSLAVALVAYSFYYADRFLPHTSIASVKLGGLTKAEAGLALQEYTAGFLDRDLTFTHQAEDGEQKTWQLAPRELGTAIATDVAIDQLWATQKPQDWQRAISTLLGGIVRTYRGSIEIEPVSESGESILIEQVLGSIERPYTETSISFVPGNVSIIPGQAGVKLDRDRFEEELFAAYQKNGTTINLGTTVSQPELSAEQATGALEHARLLLAADWKILGGEKSIDFPAKSLADLLSTTITRDEGGRALALDLSFKEDKLTTQLQAWAAQIDREPTNAQLRLVNDRVEVELAGVNGAKVNVERSATEFKQELLAFALPAARALELETEEALPPVRAETLTALGLVARIGTATTDYSGSPVNRKLNIALGQRSLNRKLVMPGQTFSTVKALGPISEATGYLPELVILNNRTVPEAGGGLCQVSTTLFRSVLNAGLPVTERTNHSYRVSYYERVVGPGLDATIYEPKPDFAWKNDMATAVFVQSYVKGDKITFDIFGTPDGRIATVGKPVILREYPPGEPIYVETDTLYVDERKQLERAHSGASTTVSYVVTKDGKEHINQTFRSYYKPWPEQWLVGTKPR